MKNYSFVYRGFLIEQTNSGWVVPQMPNRGPFGIQNQGPFSTRFIAQHNIDLLLDTKKV